MINWNRVNELRDDFGEDVFTEIVTVFLEETDGVINRLKSVGIDPELGKTMHFLKGSALNLGFTQMASLSQLAETAATQNQASLGMIANVINSYESSKSHFRNSLAPTFAA